MPQIKFAYVDPCLDWDNVPTIEAELTNIPTIQTPWKIIHEDSEGTLALQQDGIFAAFLYEDKHNHEGFGGRHFELLLEDGTSRTFRGPWSSRAACVNKYISEPQKHLVEIHYRRSGALYSGAILLSEALDLGIPLIRIPSKDEMSREEWTSFLTQDSDFFRTVAISYDPDEGPQYIPYGKWAVYTKNKKSRIFSPFKLDHPIAQFLVK